LVALQSLFLVIYCIVTLSQSSQAMQTIKIKFKDEFGYYFYSFSYHDIEDLWAKVCKEERVYKSIFVEINQD
jgi:hypothetical protein